MIDINLLREKPDLFKKAATDKGIEIDIDQILLADTRRRDLLKEIEDLRAQQNKANDNIAKAEGEDKQKAIAEMKTISDKTKELEPELRKVEKERKSLLQQVPMIPDSDTPIGKDDKDNVELKKVGNVPEFDFTPLNHEELGKKLNLMDLERGTKVAGARGYYLKNDGVRLEQSVLQSALQFIMDKGFTPLSVPTIAPGKYFTGSGFFPWFKDEIYQVKDKEKTKYLVGTSEVTLCGYHADEVLKEEDLPLRYTALTPCFRTEVGSYGKDAHGLYRVHQFYKVEQVVFCANEEQARQEFEDIQSNAEEFLNLLELPYRVVQMCTGDMGALKVKSTDIETWMPSREGYGETHSCSWLGDAQARRLNIKYQNEKGEKKYVHTLNNTLVATPRILIALLENHQQKDGSIKLPPILASYLNKKVIK